MEIYETHISQHAIDRYRLRIGKLPEASFAARLVMFGEMLEANDKHLLKAFVRKQRTAMIPTKNAMFVVSFGNVVTVLERDRSAA